MRYGPNCSMLEPVNEGRDRLRELLDAVLDEDNADLGAMAADAYASPFHFSRQLRRSSGESPVALRRRVLLERAAWSLRQGATVTEAAWQAGFESAEGFSRAFSRAYGHPPSTPAADHWLPAPNGIHFHPPVSLWVHADEPVSDHVTDLLLRHDCADTAALLQLADGLADDLLRRPLLPQHWVVEFDGREESIMDLLDAIVWTKEVWMASFAGHDFPTRVDVAEQRVADLAARHEWIAGEWLTMLNGIETRGRWHDRLIDALCDPPESFVISTVVAHVLTYSVHRRQLVRSLLRRSGIEVDRGDPIVWWRAAHGHHAPDTSTGQSPATQGERP